MKHDWRRLRTGWTPLTHQPTPAAPPLPPPPPPSQSILTQPPLSVGSCLTCALLRSSPQPPFSTTFCPTESCCCTLVKTHRIRGATISQTCSLSFREELFSCLEGSPELCKTKISPRTMFCILWGSDVSNWSENIAETEFWELVEHAAQFLKAPICETQALFKICLFLCCPSL